MSKHEKITLMVDNDLVVIRPSLHKSILHVGDYFAGYFNYTCVSLKVAPEGKLSDNVLKAVANAMEKWEERTTHLPLTTHIRVRDEFRALKARYGVYRYY